MILLMPILISFYFLTKQLLFSTKDDCERQRITRISLRNARLLIKWSIFPKEEKSTCSLFMRDHHLVTITPLHQSTPPLWNTGMRQRHDQKRISLCVSVMFVGVYSWAELCLTFVPDRSVQAWWYFGDEKATEERCEAKMWEGSWWGSIWLIFPLAAWQGGDMVLIMNCDTLMSLSSTDNTWSALLPFNLWYQRGKLQPNKGFVSLAKSEHDFKNSTRYLSKRLGCWRN